MYLRWKVGYFEVLNTTHTSRKKLIHGALRRLLSVANTINTTELYLISYQVEQNDGASVERGTDNHLSHLFSQRKPKARRVLNDNFHRSKSRKATEPER